MTKLASSFDQVIKNIKNYPAFIGESSDIKDRLAMNRAWYAHNVGDQWHFGSSKIIGYANLTPEAYLSQDHDGRQTEATLQKWFIEVGPEHPMYKELWENLSEFLAGYGKNPSKLARINIPISEIQIEEGENTHALCNLIVEVAKGLAHEQIKAVRNRLKALL
ncbi:MAG: hypothetical protein WD046_07140 [Paracoccaceae bacterium]